MVTTADAVTERPHHNGVPFPGTTDQPSTAITRRTTTVAAGPQGPAAPPHRAATSPRRRWRWPSRERREAAPAATLRSAQRFLWAWVMLSMLFSAAANATDSWLTAPEHLRVLAVIRSVAPPVFIGVTTHIAGILLKAREFGAAFVLSLLIDAVVSVFSFVLSYSAISHLMAMLGTSPNLAGLWPLAIDFLGVDAAVALFTLSYRRSRAAADAPADGDDEIPARIVSLAVRDDLEPVSASERRQWWESVAGTVQDRNQLLRAISERSPREIADVLRLTHDDGLSQRAIADVVGLNSRLVRAIQRAGDEVLHIDTDQQG